MNANTEDAAPRRGSLLVIFLAVFIDLLGFGIVLPLLPIYGEQFAAAHALSEAQTGWVVGLLMACFSAMQFLFLPVWGRLSDLFGRRPILLIGLFGSTCFYALFGLATAWESLTWLFVTRIGAGISGATISTAQAYIADTTAAHNRTKGMALIGAAFALGFTIGPIIGAASLLIGSGDRREPVARIFRRDPLRHGVPPGLLALARIETADSGTARRSLFDWQGLRVALALPSVGTLLLISFIVICSLAAFESTLALEIRALHDSALASADGQSTMGSGNWLDA